MTGFPYYVTKHQSCRERKLIWIMTPTTVRVLLINNLIILKFKLDQAQANENFISQNFSNIASWNTIKQSDILFKPLTNHDLSINSSIWCLYGNEKKIHFISIKQSVKSKQYNDITTRTNFEFKHFESWIKLTLQNT